MAILSQPPRDLSTAAYSPDPLYLVPTPYTLVQSGLLPNVSCKEMFQLCFEIVTMCNYQIVPLAIDGSI